MNAGTFRADDLDWLCREAGIAPGSRMRHAMGRRHVDADSDQAIAAEMGISVSGVRSHISQGWAKIAAYLQRPTRAARLAELVAEAQARAGETQPESYRQRAAALLGAVKGPANGGPAAAVLDDNERKAANHDPLIDVWDAERVIGLADLEREMRENRGVG